MAMQIIYFISMICSAVVLGQIYVDVIHYEPLDGKMCTAPLFSVVSQSEIACAAKCAMETSCKSHFFIPRTQECIGCDSSYQASDLATLSDKPGAVYKKPYALYNQNCSIDEKPCIENNTVCFAGLDTCVCDPLFEYNPSSKSCISGCSVYGSTYQWYPKYVFVGYDGFWQYFKDDPASCLSYCTHNSTYTCYGVDWDYIGKICYYNNARTATNPIVWAYSANVFHTYTRNCA